MRQLKDFRISARETDFVLELLDEDGETVAFAAEPDRVEAIIEALDELLGDDEDAEAYQKPLG